MVIKAEGRAFSAGGDILDVYQSERGSPAIVQFFADEYRLNAQIARYPKPYVALIDGIVMGGGVGVSFHGSHRVLTENAKFAMPEVGIGFFPDVGASHLLPDLGGSFGMYLALTGNRIGYGDALWSGLANYTMKSEYQAGLLERLAETGDADLALREVWAQARRETDPPTLEKIAKHFALPSLRDIVRSLERADPTDEFAAKTLATMRTRSPTSLNVAFRAISAGLTLSMDECMQMEFRILNRMLAGPRFLRGHPRGDHRQGRYAQMEPGDARGGRPRRHRALFRAARRAGACAVSERRAQPALVRAVDGGGHLLLVPPRGRRLLPAVRRALLDQADRRL